MKTQTKLLIIISFFFTSCSTKVDMVEEGEGIPVVYSILDPTDKIHYIRINKSFNGNSDIYDIAKNPDSLFFSDSLDVKILVQNNKNETVKELIFNKHYLKKDSVNRQGNVVFAVKKHYVYASNTKLPAGDDFTYRLEIKKANGNLFAWANTPSLYEFDLYYPVEKMMVELKIDRFLLIKWHPGSNSRLVMIDYTLYYYERNSKEGKFYEQKIKISSGLLNTKSKTCGFHGIDVINQLIKHIDETESADIDRRYLGRIILDYSVANTDLSEQILLDNSGTMGYNETEYPTISNIYGGYGLLGAKLTGQVQVFFDSKTIDDFRNLFNEKNKWLKFVSEIFYEELPDSLPWKERH